MDKKLDFSGLLDFSEIDLTAPNVVVAGFAEQIENATNGIIKGKVAAYDGHVFSYTQKGYDMKILLSATEDKHIDIQTTLGRQGEKSYKYEFYINTPVYESYKFRICYLQHGLGNYPVKVILDENIAGSISVNSSKYIYTCNDRTDLEALMDKVLYSKYLISIMQELIHVYQAKKNETKTLTEAENNNMAE